MRALRWLSLLAAVTACGEGGWVLINVTVIDVERGVTVSDAVVVVRDGRIVAMGPADDVAVPGNAEVVDGGDGYVIPGLWDMHVHVQIAGSEVLPVIVANGVTGVRDMGGDLARIDTMRNAIRAGVMIGPRILRAGRWVDGQKELTDRYILEIPDEGRAAVRELAAAGVDHIKVHNGLPRDVFFAVAEEARAVGLPLVGHVPMDVHPAEAIDAGLVTVEHIATIFEGTLSRGVRGIADQLRVLEEFPSETADTLGEHFRAAGAWFDPTMVAYAVNSRLAELEASPDPRRAYIPARLEEHWDESFPIADFELDPRVIAFRKRGDTAFAAVVTALHGAGVGLLVGTDLGTREIYPGFSVHDELAMLVERAGLSPIEALRAATLNPARYLGATDSLGTVAAGRVADFVLLEANPLDDIRHTTRIRGVMVRGRYYDREWLDGVLETALAAGM